MKPFLLSIVVAGALAVGMAVALEAYVQKTTDAAFATTGARVPN
ncbi:MAG: hypothetical protein NW215_13870 [Hyphomicrobiales bacterium]|nr:hypothetical protein [Hyphomicrobiales bacterium]